MSRKEEIRLLRVTSGDTRPVLWKLLDHRGTRSRGRGAGGSRLATWSRSACDPDAVHRVTTSASSHPGRGFKHGHFAKAVELRRSTAIVSCCAVWDCNWLQIAKSRHLDWLSRVKGSRAPQFTPRVTPKVHLGNHWDGFCKCKDSQNDRQRIPGTDVSACRPHSISYRRLKRFFVTTSVKLLTISCPPRGKFRAQMLELARRPSAQTPWPGAERGG